MGDRVVERLYQGCRWAEGPVYFPAARMVVWSDIPNDRLLRWDEVTGQTGVFRHPAGYANGNALDSEGRLVTCEQGRRRITRTEHDGSITVLVECFEGKLLNSPNDLAISSDGALWFTDSSYGIDSDYEGRHQDGEIGGCHLYRLDPLSGRCDLAASGFVRPTGLAFSPDEHRLYVADSRVNHIRAFDVVGLRTLSGASTFATNSVGNFDSMKVDMSGRVWVAAGDGIHCFHADGTLLGKVLLPEAAANLEFGGLKGNLLFMCASTSLYSIMLATNGSSRAYHRAGAA